MQQFDEAVLRAIHAHTYLWLDTVVGVVTHLAGTIFIGLCIAVALLFVVIQKWRAQAGLVLLSLAVAEITAHVLKIIIARPRPEIWLSVLPEATYSMPSAHAAGSMALALALVSICWRSRFRGVATLAGVLYVVSIAYTRMYLGVHYPTDVLVGWVVGVFAWYVAYQIIKRFRR